MEFPEHINYALATTFHTSFALHFVYAETFISFTHHLIFHWNFQDFPKRTWAVKVTPFPGLESQAGAYFIPCKIPISYMGNPSCQEHELLQTGLLPRTGGMVWELRTMGNTCIVSVFLWFVMLSINTGEDCDKW